MVRPIGTLLQEAISYTTARPPGTNKDAIVRSIGTVHPCKKRFYTVPRGLSDTKNTMLRPMDTPFQEAMHNSIHCGAASQTQEKSHLFPGVKKCINLGDPPGGRGGIPKS